MGIHPLLLQYFQPVRCLRIQSIEIPRLVIEVGGDWTKSCSTTRTDAGWLRPSVGPPVSPAGSQAGLSAECRRRRSGDRTPRGAVAGRAAGAREGLCKLRTCGVATGGDGGCGRGHRSGAAARLADWAFYAASSSSRQQLTLGAFQPSGSLGAPVHRLDGSGQIEPEPRPPATPSHQGARLFSWERLRVRPASSGRGDYDGRR